MLVIRNVQIETLSKAKEKAYFYTVLEKLRKSHLNDDTLESDEAGLKKVMQIADRSAAYGMRSVDQLDAFFNLVSRYGLDFDLNEDLVEINAILNDKSKHGSEKIVDIERLLESKDH